MAGLRRQLSIARRGLTNLATHRPLCVSFEITHACNANCEHCHRGGPVEEDLASADELARIYRQLSPPVIQVSGGEPMLRSDVLDIISKIRAGGSVPYVILVTNGSLLTPDAIRQANEAGVDAYSISLDYPDDRHDEFRMIPGLFQHLKDLIKSLEPEERKRVTLNCVVQTDNYQDILPLARLASDWGVCMNYSPYTWMRTSERDYVVPKEKLPELRQIFRELLDYEEEHGMMKSNATFLNNIVAFFEQEGIPGCRAGERFLVVNPDGTLSPCGLITTDYLDRKQLLEGFSSTNTCTACNTSIRSWTEKPFATFFSGIRPSTSSL